MLRNIFLYLKALVTDDAITAMFTILDVFGLILFFFPKVSKVIEYYYPEVKVIGISVFLIFSFLVNVRIYRKLIDQIFHLTEELKPKIEITVENISTNEEIYSNAPLTEWAMKIKVANRSKETIFFSKSKAILCFRKPNYSVISSIIGFFSRRISDFQLWFSIPIYSRGLMIISNAYQIEDFIHEIWNSQDDDTGPKTLMKRIIICNWETKEPIFFVPHQEFRGSEPNSVQLWTIFGKFPIELGQKLLKEDYHLAQIGIQFFTDQGTFIVSNNQVPVRPISETFARQLKTIETQAKTLFPEIFKKLHLKPITIKTPTITKVMHDIEDIADVRVLPVDYTTWKKPKYFEGKNRKQY